MLPTPPVGIDAAEIDVRCNDKPDLTAARRRGNYFQRRLVLVIVFTTLLSNSMQYAVIAPIIPDYLRVIAVWDTHIEGGQNAYANDWEASSAGHLSAPGNETVAISINNVPTYQAEGAPIGLLLASNAITQLLVNPFSGTIIDRIGCDVPMTIGLLTMVFSDALFACGRSYGLLFFARSLQGVGSAFADTSGLAMIAERYTEKAERSRAMGIALAFISFGFLVGPSFGGLLYNFCGKEFLFLLLALVSFVDAIVFCFVTRSIKRQQASEASRRPPSTPIWKLVADPYIILCAGALVMANVSLAFLKPTISVWMVDNMKDVQEWKLGIIWVPAFFLHAAGVVLTVRMARAHPQHQWALAAGGLALEALSCLFIPSAREYWTVMIHISVICFGIALTETALMPTLGYLVDSRHVPVYGSIYAMAEISRSIAYAIGPIIAGDVVQYIDFSGLNIGIGILYVLYAPLLYILSFVKACVPSENDQIAMSDHRSA